MKKVVLVLYGGESSEFEVSCLSAAGVLKNIDKSKYECVVVKITKEGRWQLIDIDKESIDKCDWNDQNGSDVTLSLNKKLPGLIKISDRKNEFIHIDTIFPVLHGKAGEDGSIQGAIQLSGIPYIGCKLQSSVIGFDKDITKSIVDTIDVLQARSITLRDNESINLEKISAFFKNKYPLFVKPCREGSSVGISKVDSFNELESAIKLGFKYDRKIVIEEGISGREIEVAVLGNKYPKASSVGEIVTEDSFYTYDAKYVNDSSYTKVIDDISEDIISKIKDAAINIYKLLECDSLSRVDFFLKKDGSFIFNEINTMPGFTPISMFPKLWENEGITYKELISILIEQSLEKK